METHVHLRVWDRKFVMMASSSIEAWPMCFCVRHGVNKAFYDLGHYADFVDLSSGFNLRNLKSGSGKS